MKKKVRKITLSRETLRSLDRLHGVVGGATYAIACQGPTAVGTRCVGDTGTYDTCANTYACSTHCETGGNACTALTCYC